MRRASGPQNGSSSFYVKKQAINKARSPNGSKAKSRGKISHQSNSSQMIGARKTSSFSKVQPNQSSTCFTNSTQNNKSNKLNSQSKKLKDLKKYEKQIMQILHKSASIIQREWRKYLIRKYRKCLQFNKKQQKSMNKNIKQFDSVSGITSQNQMYNNKKYYSSLQQQSKKKPSQSSFNKNVFSFNLYNNKTISNVSVQNYQLIQDVQPTNLIKNTSPCHNRTRSDQPTKIFNQKIKSITKIEQKNLQIDKKIINVTINCSSVSPEKRKKRKSQKQRKEKFEDHYIKNEKGVLDEILKKVQQKLQQKKLKRILALQNSFSNNLMTFRSYQKNIEDVAEEHNKMLTILQNKKKSLIDNFNQYVSLCDKNFVQTNPQIKQQKGEKQFKNKKFYQEQKQSDLSFNEQLSGFHSRSIAFEDWELEGQLSQKKISSISIMNRNKEQIYIEDNQKQTTIINGLMSDSKNFYEQSSQKKLISSSKQEISQLQVITPIKENKKLQTKQNEDMNKNILKTQLIYINDPELRQNTDNRIQNAKKDEVETVEKVNQAAKLIKNEKNQDIKTKKKLQQPEFNNQIYKKTDSIKKFSQSQVQNQLSKFYPIKPNMDLINNWLLDISHFILDNFGNQFLKKLINVEQPTSIQLWRHCIYRQHFNRQYISVSTKVFKQFQFFQIKNLMTELDIESQRKQSFSALMYTFHQALYDSLNKMLMDQLIQGRNWINFPWESHFKIKKLINLQYSKQSLQKAINRVSNISDYNIIPTDATIVAGHQFEYAQHNLIFAEQIKQLPLQCQFQKGFLIYQISRMIQASILQEQAKSIKSLFL